ncbi:MAG: acyl carrier protein [Acidobacteriota bacterium]|nr:acyl carrier protein [Acidobacteriota bacterium]
MDEGEILERLRGVLEASSTQALDWSALSVATTVESLGFDSLSILDVLYGIEQEFGLELDAADVIDLKTVGELVAVMAQRAA